MQDELKEINEGIWWVMLSIAFFVDLLELVLVLLPGVGEILSEFLDWTAFAGFYIWMNHLGIKYPGKNKGMLIGFVVGMIPIINDFLPEITLTIWFIRRNHKRQIKLARQAKIEREAVGTNRE
jgi:hypothetical protein